MLLVVDIGNTLIKFGIFDSNTLLTKFSIPSLRDYTNEDILAAVGLNLDLPLENAILCSVVPEIDETVAILIAEKCGVDARVVRNDQDFGLKINYEPLSAIGSDRLVNSFAATQKYGTPCIVCSFGTATTVDVVGVNNEFLGGIIAPGMETMAKALHLSASRLPDITIEKPLTIIANNTVDSIRSGIYFGQMGMIEGIIRRMSDDLETRPTVIATGGFAQAVEDETTVIDIVDENLLLEGLNLLFKRLYTDGKK